MDDGMGSPWKRDAGSGAFSQKAKPSKRIDSIEISLKSDVVASNINRVAILHLLRTCPRREMQAERIAKSIGVSHRTVLYHLDILEDYDLVRVSGFRRKGQKMLRSVWGLNIENGQAERIFRNIGKKFPPGKMRKIIKVNGYTNGCNRKASASLN
jgi:DNA-binding transcriptional ArsR family regulator